jgi:hypothetical protein
MTKVCLADRNASSAEMATSEQLERFLAEAGLQSQAISRTLELLHQEDIDSVDLLHVCWQNISEKLTFGVASKLGRALGVPRSAADDVQMSKLEQSSSAAAISAAAVVVLVVQVKLGERVDGLQLSLSPEEYKSLPVSDLLRRVAVQAYDCFHEHVLVSALVLNGGRLDLARSLAAQGVRHGDLLHAVASSGNPVHQAAVRGAQLAPEGKAAGSPAHAARVAEVEQRDEQPLNALRSFKCHGDCLPGIHCILQGQSTPAVSLVPGYLAGSGVQVLSNGYWYEVAGTAISIACAGTLQSAREREYGMCNSCKGIRSDNTIAQRLHWQREQGRGAETDALTLLQTVRTPAHVNAAFQSFFTLIKERRVLLREVDANRAALELLWERQQARSLQQTNRCSRLPR